MTEQAGRPTRLVLVGSLIVDLVMRVDELPGRGDDVLAESAHAEVGGGFAVLASARRHGLPAAFAGRYGDGPFGTAIHSALAAEGIGALVPQVPDTDSGFRAGFIEPGGRAHTFVTSPGVEARLDGDTLGRVPVHDSDAVYVSGRDLTYRETGPAVARWVHTLPRQTLVVLDPGPWVDQIPWSVHERVLRRCNVVTMTAATTRRLVGTSRPAAAWRALREYAPRLRTTVLRRGADGCWVTDSAETSPIEVPAPPVDMPAGPDADGVHTGVLLAGLAHGAGISRAALRANVAVALHSSGPGAPPAPDAAGVDRFLASRWSGD